MLCELQGRGAFNKIIDVVNTMMIPMNFMNLIKCVIGIQQSDD